jgi:hypothetical protein
MQMMRNHATGNMKAACGGACAPSFGVCEGFRLVVMIVSVQLEVLVEGQCHI